MYSKIVSYIVLKVSQSRFEPYSQIDINPLKASPNVTFLTPRMCIYIRTPGLTAIVYSNIVL